MEDTIKIELLTPLTGTFLPNEMEQDWEGEEYHELEEEQVLFDGADLIPYVSEIQEKIAEYSRVGHEDDKTDNLMDYFDGSAAIKEKVLSAVPSVKEADGVLYGCTILELKEYLETEELSELCEYLTGQYSDGWGEGFEQQEIPVEGGELCIHFWRPMDFEFQQAKPEVSKEKSEKQENPANVPKRPKMQLLGMDGNVFAVMARASKLLQENGQGQEAKEMIARVQKSENYYQALHIISEYVETELSASSQNDTKPPTYVQVDETHIEELKQVPEFARVGEYYMYGEEVSTQGFKGFFAYTDKETLYMARSQMNLADGDLPEEKNEIVVSKEWLSKFFPDCHIGDSVTLDTESFSGEYTISGILDTTGQEKQNIYSFLISKEMLEQCTKYEPDGYFAYVHLNHVNQLDGELIKSYVQKIKEELQIPGVGFHDAYFRYIDGDISMENVLLLMAFAGIVLVGGCVVIQSIFRISIIDKIKSYGQLRTVGATKKQIMRIVKKEGHSLGWKGMSIGILLGLGVTLLLFPKGFSLSGYLLVIGCTVLICWTMICLSIRKPVKLAANISPVEAVRFTSLQKKIKNRAKRKKISPCSLGMLNFRRDWKKTVSIVFSLSLGGILLLAVSSLLLLQSPEKMARQHFKNGDYKIYIDSDREHIDLLKQGNPLNEELKQEVLGIDGVEDILVTRKSASYGATFGGITARGTCDMITNENKELLAQAVVEGSMPGDNSILLKDDYRDFDGKEKLGETIELSLGKKTIPVTISGFFDGEKTDFASGHGPIGVDGPMMFLSEELFQELIPDVTNFDYSWDIVCDPEKSEKVGKALENLVVSHTDIGLDTFEDKVDSYGYMDVAYGVMQVISWFIFLFGVINLINTTLSNQYSRRQENSVLRSIGLAPKQLAQMTVWEGMGYVVSSILLMLAIGLPITLLVWRKFSISAYAGRILPYEFPWLQMGVYVVELVTVELILSVWTIRRQKKQSLIEQMRSME